MSRQKLERLMRALNRLDDAIIHTPGREFSKRKSGRPVIDALNALDRWVFSFIRGGPRRPPMKRTGNRFLDWLNRCKYRLEQLWDKLDTRVLYGGRGIRTKSGVRVRTKAEKRIAEMLDKHRITYRYEKPLRLEGIKLHPDFYLPRENVYIEFWGLVDNDKYCSIMRRKVALYRKHGINVISIYPSHMHNLEQNLARLYKKAMGKEFPEGIKAFKPSQQNFK